MALFSERHGYRKVPEKMVPESMSDELRNLLWNLIDSSVEHRDYEKVTGRLWHQFYKKPLDTRPYYSGYEGTSYHKSWEAVRKDYFECGWARVYDYIEFLVGLKTIEERLVNQILSEEFAAYRLIDGEICPITDQAEIDSIKEAVALRGKFDPVAEHLYTALTLLSDRQKPDYRNSIKESISAVESMARLITGDENATLGKLLKKLEAEGKMHPALEKGFGNIYGWSSDAEGIRHAMTEESNVSQAEAKFYLVACTAFVNYLKSISG